VSTSVSGQSYVVVSNHQSQYDIFVLYGWLGIDFKWVMKQELRKLPGLGFGCEKLGHIFIDRSRTDRALASINAAKKRVVNGVSVIFFPEGTRSKSNSHAPFQKGRLPFRHWILSMPILPVTIVGTREILPTGTLDLVPGKSGG
jgi:1-acyl-sn-glycerol-3-phosphate acyltransferase